MSAMFEWLKPAPAHPVLDTAYLARLGGHLGQAALDELLADGLIELTDRVGRLAECGAAGDAQGLARLGHDLVGLAGHLGLTRFSAAAAELGRKARGTPGPAAAAAEIAALGAEAIAALRQHLGR